MIVAEYTICNAKRLTDKFYYFHTAYPQRRFGILLRINKRRDETQSNTIAQR